jgi:hypothetical protein
MNVRMSDKNWPRYLRERVRMLSTPCGGAITVALFPIEVIEIADKIEELQALLRRAHHELNTWQDPMVGPFERLLNDIEVAIGEEDG